MSLGTPNLNKNEIIIHGITGLQLIQVDYIYSQIVIVPMKFMYKIVDRNEAKNKSGDQHHVWFSCANNPNMFWLSQHRCSLSFCFFFFYHNTNTIIQTKNYSTKKPQMIIEIAPDH